MRSAKRSAGETRLRGRSASLHLNRHARPWAQIGPRSPRVRRRVVVPDWPGTKGQHRHQGAGAVSDAETGGDGSDAWRVARGWSARPGLSARVRLALKSKSESESVEV